MIVGAWPQKHFNRHLTIRYRLVGGEKYLAETSGSKPSLDQIVAKPIADRDHDHPLTFAPHAVLASPARFPW